MADDVTPRPGDTDNKLLQKILSALTGGNSGGSVTPAFVVVIQPKSFSSMDNSGTIVSGGVSQLASPAHSDRKYFLFENVSGEDMWINFGTPATASQPSIKVVPNGSYTMESTAVFTDAVYVVSATTGSQYTIKEA